MNLPATYNLVLEALRDGPKTPEQLQTLEGDVPEALLCLVARGLIKSNYRTYWRDEEAIQRDREARR